MPEQASCSYSIHITYHAPKHTSSLCLIQKISNLYLNGDEHSAADHSKMFKASTTSFVDTILSKLVYMSITI